jgi:uroporphyrinogen-III synthase
VDVPALRAQFPQMQFVSIGPQTTQAAREQGLEIATEAKVHTVPGMVDAILELVARK